MLVSKYGFTDVLEKGLIVLDPTRMAAQVVSGIGFLGAGLIFVRRDAVRGLTTAAAIWVTAAVGSVRGSNPLSSTELFRVKRPVRLLSEPYSRRPDDLVNRSSS
jgi:putative Mg2+ transporter-C (MgtC) family protein